MLQTGSSCQGFRWAWLVVFSLGTGWEGQCPGLGTQSLLLVRALAIGLDVHKPYPNLSLSANNLSIPHICTIPRNLELLRASQVFQQVSALYLIFRTVFHPCGRFINYLHRLFLNWIDYSSICNPWMRDVDGEMLCSVAILFRNEESFIHM